MKTDEAKTEIFDSIRRNLAASLPFDEIHREHQAHRQSFEKSPIAFVDKENKNLAGIFQENLVAVGANCEIVGNIGQAISEIEKIIEECGATKIAVSDSELIEEITEALQTKAEISVNASKAVLFETDLGITGAQFAIAETGTLVIGSDKEFNRLTSLVPPVHVCVLEASQIRATLSEVLSELEKDLSRSITFITGQSRTSDIELTLALGVHGPGELFVILIDKKTENGKRKMENG
jgi:L-lactate dehydrogenase complex protein LldG